MRVAMIITLKNVKEAGNLRNVVALSLVPAMRRNWSAWNVSQDVSVLMVL